MNDPSLPSFPFYRNAKLIVGVSGGSDSMGLLALLREKTQDGGVHLTAAHVNYGLRGKDAIRDEETVRYWCGAWDIPLRVLRVSNFKVKVKKQKRSPQDLAREIRYGFFLKLARQEKAWGVAVAHHREDQAETVLDRFLRGAGARGLSGLRINQTLQFPQNRKLKIWRPLLSYSKRQIEDYLKSRGIAWRKDKSNQKAVYRRNQIRLEVLPFLARWNPNLIEVLSRMGEVMTEEDILMEEILKPLERKVKSRWGRNVYTCNALFFGRAPLALQRRWVRHVSEKLIPLARGLSFERIEEVIRLWAGAEKGPRDLGFGLKAGRSQNEGFLSWKRD